MEYYSATRNNDLTKFLLKWLHVENIILSEITQSQKNRHNMQSLIMEYYPQKALNTPETTHRLREVQGKRKEKKKKYAQSLPTKKTLTNSWLHPVLHVLYAHCN